MSQHLRITLLGDFCLLLEEKAVLTLDAPRLQALLAFLVLHRGVPQSRRYIAFTFWPDSSEKQALTNLRQLIYHFRRALSEAEAYLEISTKSLYWKINPHCLIDVEQFESEVANAKRALSAYDWRGATTAFRKAVAVYKGDLVPSCYDAWIEPFRLELRQQVMSAIEELVRLLEDERKYEEAAVHAEKLLQFDPLRESTYRLLMRLYMLNHDRGKALELFDQCKHKLWDELGVEPGSATQEVYRGLLKHRAGALSAKGNTSLQLVARRQEWKDMRNIWRASSQGQSALLLITGEAGIGKTCLAENLIDFVSRQGAGVAQARCYAAEGRLAYAPVAEWLRSDALWQCLSDLDEVWLAELSRLLPELASIYPDIQNIPPHVAGEQRLFEAAARAVLTYGEPLLLMVDDLHWVDPETLRWLRFLLRSAQHTPLLIVGTVRSEEIHDAHALLDLRQDLRRDGQVIDLSLGPLNEEETATLAEQIVAHRLDAATLDRLYRETEGYPLFIVETVRGGLLQQGIASATSHQIPPKVQAVLGARLAQLSDGALSLAQVAATIGRSFSRPLLAAAHRSTEEAMEAALHELWQRHLIREQGPGRFDFSHDKLREAAYTSAGPVRQSFLHLHVAKAIEDIYADELDAFCSELAVHYEQAGYPKKAIHYFHQAGLVAQRVYAHQEAIRLLRRGLTLVRSLPTPQTHSEKQVHLLEALGVSLVSLHYYGAPGVVRTYTQVQRLHKQSERAPSGPALRALASAAMMRCELGQAAHYGRALLELATRYENPIFLVEAHYVLGSATFWQGNFADAITHFETALARFDAKRRQEHVHHFAQDPEVVCTARRAYSLWYLGYPDQACRQAQRGLDMATKHDHPFSLAYASTTAAMIHLECGLSDHILLLISAWREEAIQKSIAPLWLHAADVSEGFALTMKYRMESGIDLMKRGIHAYGQQGPLAVPTMLAWLADACLKQSLFTEARAALTEGFRIGEQHEQRYHEAELHRLRGELYLLQDKNHQEAQASFEIALQISRQQHGRSFELRAATSMARLLKHQGKAEDARRVLEPAYAWFTEGFDLPDLKGARKLLDQMA